MSTQGGVLGHLGAGLLGGVILAQPFDDKPTVVLLLPDDDAQSLPGSCAPAIVHARAVPEQLGSARPTRHPRVQLGRARLLRVHQDLYRRVIVLDQSCQAL
jgi:hypothetical protein